MESQQISAGLPCVASMKAKMKIVKPKPMPCLAPFEPLVWKYLCLAVDCNMDKVIIVLVIEGPTQPTMAYSL